MAAASERPGRIIVPCHQGRRGHPVLLPWSLAGEVAALGVGEGVNAILARHDVVEIACGPEAVAADIDTPADFRRLQDR
jgi:molybdenum cofactor cytidylyltransferase